MLFPAIPVVERERPIIPSSLGPNVSLSEPLPLYLSLPLLLLLQDTKDTKGPLRVEERV